VIIVYTPADGEPEHYDASSLKVSEASIVSRTIDMKWAEISESLQGDDIDAMRGIVWVLKKRTQPALRFGEFDPGVNEMTTRFDKDEAVRVIENALAVVDEQDEDVTPEAVRRALNGLVEACADREHAQALVDARLAAGPKEPAEPAEPSEPEATSAPSETPTSPSSATSTSDSSPTSATSPLATSTP